MRDFDYHRPTSLDEARELLGNVDGEVKLLAGGQSLLPVMKLDMAAPSALISLSAVPELGGIAAEDGTLTIGAGSTHTDVHESDVVREAIPALAELAGLIGDPAVRNRGTIGGSVAHADPAADYPAALVALNATVVTDRREIGAEDFFVGMFTTALEDDEIVLGVRFPAPGCSAYAKFRNPASRYALAGVMVARGVGGEGGGGVRVAVTGAGPSVFRVEAMEEALAGTFSPDALDGVEVDPGDLLDDDDASAEYRAHLVGVMARRAVERCG